MLSRSERSDRAANVPDGQSRQVTIRVLGGLLSAYHLSDGDKLYLDRAIDLADRILPIFDTVSLPRLEVCSPTDAERAHSHPVYQSLSSISLPSKVSPT
jgi:hypothetical protein